MRDDQTTPSADGINQLFYDNYARLLEFALSHPITIQDAGAILDGLERILPEYDAHQDFLEWATEAITSAVQFYAIRNKYSKNVRDGILHVLASCTKLGADLDNATDDPHKELSTVDQCESEVWAQLIFDSATLQRIAQINNDQTRLPQERQRAIAQIEAEEGIPTPLPEDEKSLSKHLFWRGVHAAETWKSAQRKTRRKQVNLDLPAALLAHGVKPELWKGRQVQIPGSPEAKPRQRRSDPIKPVPRRTACDAWLTAFLYTGPKPAATVKTEAIKLNFGRQLLSGSVKRLSVIKHKDGFGGPVYWELSNSIRAGFSLTEINTIRDRLPELVTQSRKASRYNLHGY